MIENTYAFEKIIKAAAKIDEQIHDAWMDFIVDDEYDTLCQLFDEDNFPHPDPFDEGKIITPDTKKIMKQILVGKDRIDLIHYAFLLGQLVGRATEVVRQEQ